MSAIFMRSALVHYGHNPAPDVARVEIDWRGDRHVITWADVMRERREWQAEILRRKREPSVVWRACRVWVAYFDQDFFGGWQAFIGDHRGRRGETWIDRDRKWLRPELMNLFRVCLPFGRDERERFDDWKVAFAREYQRGTHHGRPRGCAFLWWDGKWGMRKMGATG